jgi:hypothetical protein
MPSRDGRRFPFSAQMRARVMPVVPRHVWLNATRRHMPRIAARI